MRNLHKLLLDEIGDGRVLRCAIGINWTIVECEFGCGLAQTPQNYLSACKPISIAGSITGQTLSTVSDYVNSSNPIEVSLAVAAMNAYFNRSDLQTENTNGLDIFSEPGSILAVVGRFPGLERRGFKPLVIEMDPKAGEFPAEKSQEVIDQCDYVIITASAIINRTIDDLLNFSENKKVAVIGPGTPLTRVLFEHGINVLSGMLINEPELAFRIVSEGGAVQALKRAGKYATLTRI